LKDHLAKSQLRGVALGLLPLDESSTAGQHLSSCETCQLQFAEELTTPAKVIAFNLKSETWFKHDHFNLEQFTGLIDDQLDSETAQILGVHLDSCTGCQTQVKHLRALRHQNVPENRPVSLARPGHRGNVVFLEKLFTHQRTLAIAAMILICVAVISVVLISRLSRPRYAIDSKVPITPNSPAGPPTREDKSSSELNVVSETLKDGGQTITVYEDGRFEGLNQLSSSARQQISLALQKGYVSFPTVLKELSPTTSSLRGNDGNSAFKLIYPSRQVIIESRPIFRWQPVPDASSYQVYVMNSAGKQVVKSELLPPTQTSYVSPYRLTRGEVFQWAVIAIINDKEIISPAPAETEMRFAILSAPEKRELDQMNASNSSLARGVFFARAGLLVEAQIELQKLVQQNPDSILPRQLLKSVEESKQSR